MKETAKREDLIRAVAVETGYTKKDTEIFFKALEKCTRELLETHGELDWYGMMTLFVDEVPEKTYIMPNTGKTVTKPANKVVKCKLKPMLKKYFQEQE